MSGRQRPSRIGRPPGSRWVGGSGDRFASSFTARPLHLPAADRSTQPGSAAVGTGGLRGAGGPQAHTFTGTLCVTNLFWLYYPSTPPQIEARNMEALLLAQEAYEELVASMHIPSKAHLV